MQRLFSTFPSGRPGIGLLIVRIAVGTSLLLDTWIRLRSDPSWLATILLTAALLLAVVLFIGFMTPMAAVLAAAAALLTEPAAIHGIAVSLALGLLGPGAYSLDARLFGRREIVITDPGRGPSAG